MQEEKQYAYCREVLRFRKALNLTSVDNEDEFIQRFTLPSVALLAWMPESGRVLDIGSGMGVPGIPLLIERPGLHGVLVERRKKRAEFLRHVVRQLGLSADVYDADVTKLPGLHVDVCVARAVTHVQDLLAMCAPHVNTGAVAVLPMGEASGQGETPGWQLNGRHIIDVAGAKQQVQCYRWLSSGG